MSKKPKPITAFAAYHPRAGSGLNAYWIRASAREVRHPKEAGDWKKLHKDGWRVVKVKVTAIGEPR